MKPEYPGLKKDEIAVMNRFLAGKYLEGEYIYDVKLYLKKHLYKLQHPSIVFRGSISDMYGTMMLNRQLLSKETAGFCDLQASRIDCVVETDSEIWLLEVTPKLKKHAWGGCQGYHDLFMYQFQPTKPLRLGIVAGIDDPRFHFTLKRLGIKLWVV